MDTSEAHLVQLLPKQGHREQIAHGLSSRVLSISTRGGPTASLGNVFHYLTPCTVKEVFLIIKQNIKQYFSLCLLPLALSVGSTEMKHWLHLLYPPSQVFIHMGKTPLSILFCRLS